VARGTLRPRTAAENVMGITCERRNESWAPSRKIGGVVSTPAPPGGRDSFTAATGGGVCVGVWGACWVGAAVFLAVGGWLLCFGVGCGIFSGLAVMASDYHSSGRRLVSLPSRGWREVGGVRGEFFRRKRVHVQSALTQRLIGWLRQDWFVGVGEFLVRQDSFDELR
jgi:hypothetical protein